MSAAASLPLDETPAPLPPRPSGPRLLKRLLTKPGLAGRLRDLEVVGYGGRQVLGAVAKLVATEGDGETYAVHPTLSPGGLARKVVSMQGLTNSAAAEALTNGVLASLAAAELIELVQDGVRLPLPPLPDIGSGGAQPSSVVAFSADGKPPPVRLGARRKGESWEDYHARCAAVKAQREREWKAAASGQRSLALPPTLVGSVHKSEATYGNRTSDSHENKSGLICDIEGGISVSPTSQPRVEEDDDSEILISQSSSSSSSDVRAHATNLSENKSADISRQDVDISADLSPEACILAVQISRGLELGADQAAMAPRAVQNWLKRWPQAAALIPEALERCRAANEGKRLDGQKPIRKVGYVRQVLQGLLEAEHAAAERPPDRSSSASPAPEARPIVDPRVLEHPLWASAPAPVQKDIGRVLDARAEPNPGERMRRLSSCHKVRREAFDLVAVRYPTLYEDAGKEPPADLDVRADPSPTAPA